MLSSTLERPSGEGSVKIDDLRADYRSAFRNWVSADKTVRTHQGAPSDAKVRAAAAAQAYEQARDLLTAEMLAPKA
jgi:hypothetical protein